MSSLYQQIHISNLAVGSMSGHRMAMKPFSCLKGLILASTGNTKCNLMVLTQLNSTKI